MGSSGLDSPLILQLGFFYAPNLAQSHDLERFEKEKSEKFFFWPQDWDRKLTFSGLGRGWKGWRNSNGLASHAWVPATRWSPVNALLAWIGHAIDLWRFAKRGPVIAFMVMEGGLGAAVTKLISRRRIHLILRVEGDPSSRSVRRNERFKLIGRQLIGRFVTPRADLVIANSQFTKGLALSFGAKPGRVLIAMSRPRWDARVQVTPLPPEPRVLFAGRLYPEKGVDVLLEAMARVRAEVPNCELLIAGEGPSREELERQCQRLSIEKFIHFSGVLDEARLHDAYVASYVVVLPSLFAEGWSQALTEAALLGRPLVASDIGALNEVVRHNVSGLLVRPGDPVELAEAIIAILKNQEMAVRMSRSARRIAVEWLNARQQDVERVQAALSSLTP